MRKQGTHFIPTLVISILVGIMLPLATTSRPIVWRWFFYVMAMGFTLVWVGYSVLLLVTTFLGKGRLRIKVANRKNPTIVRFEIPDPKQKS